MADSPLVRARRLFNHRRFPEVIQLLEPIIFTYRDSFPFYYLLGTSCLYTGDAGGSMTYLRRAHQLKPGDTHAITALAAAYVRTGDVHEAVELYLEALDKEPHNRTAKKALDFLRRHGDPDSIAELVDAGNIGRIFPFPARPWIVPGAAALLVVGILAGVWAAVPGVSDLFARKAPPARPEIERIVIDDGKDLTELGGRYRYILTKKQVAGSFAAAKAYFQEFRDNKALIELNRLMNSNASAPIKEKAQTLSRYVAKPSFENLKDNLSYAEVRADPVLAAGCSVAWRGRITNIVTTARGITFDFLVGYDEEKVLEGIVPVTMPFAAVLDPSFPYEILGTVSLENSILGLRAVSIHQLGK